MGDSVASRSAYYLPIITKTEGTIVIVGRDVVENPVRVDRQMLVWLWELKVVRNREMTVSKLCSKLNLVKRKGSHVHASGEGKVG